MVIQTRVFNRVIVIGASGLQASVNAAISAVVTEVNDFIRPMGSKCLDVAYNLSLVDTSSHSVYTGTVIYLE